MFADKTLTPRETVRLCALGTIADAPKVYAEVAREVRDFITRITGPSLDLLGSSMELLHIEGLIRTTDGSTLDDTARLEITEAGREELRRLMTANLRSSSDLSKLVTALKFRFLHLLPPADRRAQAELLLDARETELNRLLDMRKAHGQPGGPFTERLDHEIAQAERGLAWMEAVCDALPADLPDSAPAA
jgi:DNA-binding PadR family transcriptional regulator